jgi:alpha-L-rhamnosidase
MWVVGGESRLVASANGHEVGVVTNMFMPEKLDITSRVRPGRNTLSVVVPVLTAQIPAAAIFAMRLDFSSGDPAIVVSGPEWRSSDGPVQDLGLFGREPWGQVGYIEERALPARMLRKEFTAPRKVARATAYVAGLGLFELYVNGSKIGDQVLAPGLTDYEKRVQYMTFDVTGQVRAGNNAVGLILGNGRFWAPRRGRNFGYPKALAQLEIEYSDGSKQIVATDRTWKLTIEGAIRANNEFDGEEYDGRLEMPGWSEPGFNDRKWEAARVVGAPGGVLSAQMAEPIRVVETLHPVRMTEPEPGVYVFDMGQNMVGWCRLKVAGPKGTRIGLRHAERLRADGGIDVENLRAAKATDLYTLAGRRQEIWEPRFTYHGFRYVEVRGYPGRPEPSSVEGRVTQDALEKTGEFTSSNALLNQIHHNIYWGVRGNLRSIPTDCPQRDERQGWLGDRSQVSRSEAYLFDVAAFYSKWERDIADSQRADGAVPDVAPAYAPFYTDNVTWPSTFLFLPDLLREQYGDGRVLARQYPAMRTWIEHMNGYLKDGLMAKDQYGDWCVPPESPTLIHSMDPSRVTDGGLLATAYYYKMLRLMSGYARRLGKETDAAEYEALSNTVQAAFQAKYFHAASATYGNGTQTASLLPLAFGLAPEGQQKAVFASLIRKIDAESQRHVGTGLVGIQWLLKPNSNGAVKRRSRAGCADIHNADCAV